MSEFGRDTYSDGFSKESEIAWEKQLQEHNVKDFNNESSRIPPVIFSQPKSQNNVQVLVTEIEVHCDPSPPSSQIDDNETDKKENEDNGYKASEINHQQNEREEKCDNNSGGKKATIVMEEVDYDASAATEENIMSQPGNEIPVAPIEANKIGTFDEDNNISFLSACAHIVFTGRDSVQLLGCVLRHFKEKTGNYHFPIITVNGESVKALQGISLHAHINATIINACPPTPIFILILENFSDDKICELYESGFVLEMLQAPYRRAHVIFLSPFSIKKLDKIARYGPMVVQADFAHWMITSRTNAFQDEGPTVSEIERDLRYTTSGTMKIQDVKEKESNRYSKLAVLSQPLTNFGDKVHQIQLLHSGLEIKTVPDPKTSSGHPNNSQKLSEKEVGGAIQERVTSQCIGCFDGMLSAICTLFTQCGDCCFY